MFEASLFFGIALDEHIQGCLDTANPHLVQTFVNNESEYLHKTNDPQGKPHIGKFLEVPKSVEELQMVEQNVRSLLGRFKVDTAEAFSLFTVAKKS